ERGGHPGPGEVAEVGPRGARDTDVERDVGEPPGPGGAGRITVGSVRLARDLPEGLIRELDVVIADVVGVGSAQADVIPGVDPADARQVVGRRDVPDPGTFGVTTGF